MTVTMITAGTETMITAGIEMMSIVIGIEMMNAAIGIETMDDVIGTVMMIEQLVQIAERSARVADIATRLDVYLTPT